MATQTLEFDYVAGLDLTAKLFPVDSDTQVGSDLAPTEATNRDGLYSVALTDLAAGLYKLRVYVDGNFAAAFQYIVTAVTATFRPVDDARIVAASGSGYVPPITDEPIGLDDAKTHLRITHSFEDDYIESLIRAARVDLENRCWRAFVRMSRTIVLQNFPPGKDPIYLPRPPLVSVDSITYLDANGDSQTLTGFRVDATRDPGCVVPAYGTSWPTTREDPAAVAITFTAGFAAGECPENARHCVRLLLAELYEHRPPAVSEKRTTLDRMLEMLQFRDRRILGTLLGDVSHGLGV